MVGFISKLQKIGLKDMRKILTILLFTSSFEGELYVMRGRAAKELGDYQNAHGDFLESFELMPDSGYQYYSINFIVDNINSSLSLSNLEKFKIQLENMGWLY